MPQPAVWDNDPPCGHTVSAAYQTHYCTYIRVPRLLTLQPVPSDDPDRLWLVAVYQWYELWFKILLRDIQTAVDPTGNQDRTKFWRRGIKLLHLLGEAMDLAEMVIVREAKLKQPIAGDERYPLVSEQLREIVDLARRLSGSPDSDEAPLLEEYRSRLSAFADRFQRFVSITLSPSESAPGYAERLSLDVLLNLQNGVKAGWTRAGETPMGFWHADEIGADENLFIVVHQCFELWFKVVLDHVDRVVAALERDDIRAARGLLARIVPIQQLLVSQIQMPATMSALDFLAFRHQKRVENRITLETGLSPASGTESYQFREIEIACGLRNDPVFARYLQGSDKLPIRLLTPRQAERLQGISLSDAFSRAVERRGLKRIDDLFTGPGVINPNADLLAVADLLIEFDEFFRMWRLAHVSMVEKMIGSRSGTGFLGPEYLMETAGIQIQQQNRIFEERQIRPRFFQELWDVRNRLGNE